MDILINATSYGVYIDTVSETGGKAVYQNIKAWNTTEYNISTSYENWVLEFTIIASTDTKTLIAGFTTTATTYTIVIGETGVFKTTYTNMLVDNFSKSMDAETGLEMLTVKFFAPGLRAYRVQA